MIDSDWGFIDPSVFIDDDGQAYLYWGNNGLWYVKLNEDMVSYSGSIVKVDDKDQAAFGPDYEEGPWLYKRNGVYYLLYASNGVPEDISYSTSDSPTGPWVYKGIIMPKGEPKAAFTNHCGIIDFKGNSYFFYHNEALPEGGGFNRSTCIEQFTYNQDGTIPTMQMTAGVVTGTSNLNPFQRNEAETIAWSEGIKSMQNTQIGVFVKAIKDRSYTKVKGVDFRAEGASKFIARVGTIHSDVTMETRLDSVDGKLIGIVKIPKTGGSDKLAVETIDIVKTTGVHDLYFIFKGHGIGELAFFDYWMFSK